MIRLWAGPMRGDRRITVFGPLRNREPERTAYQFLTGIRAGKCRDLLLSLSTSIDQLEGECAKEASDPLRSWKLIDRRDRVGTSEMTFEYASDREDWSQHEWLEMRVQGESGSWRVSMYGRVY